jgi:hypothetical protein
MEKDTDVPYSILCEPIRLFVGGLPSTVSSTQIGQRFESFGKVIAVELVPEKTGTVTSGNPLHPCRGFAYVQLRPNDDASLRRCISMVNLQFNAFCPSASEIEHYSEPATKVCIFSFITVIMWTCGRAVQWVQMAGRCAAS